LRRALAALLLPLLLTAQPAGAFQPAGTAVPLNPEDPEQTRLGRLAYLGGIELRSDQRGFGGFSSLAVRGDRLLAVSDRGFWLAARIVSDGAGRLTGLADAKLAPLRDPDGDELPTFDALSDAESLTRTPSGDYVVAFEREHRLWRYDGSDPLTAPAQPVPAQRRVFSLPANAGFEAIAALADGRLLLIAEGKRDPAGDFVAWLLGDGGVAARLSYAATGEFRPTDAEALPNGDVLVLERRFTGLLGGFAARVTLIPAASLQPGSRVTAEEIALMERPLTLDNFEGLAVSRAPDGATLVWLMTDNNINTLLERTLLLQFRLD
jgi:hypothetical protein